MNDIKDLKDISGIVTNLYFYMRLYFTPKTCFYTYLLTVTVYVVVFVSAATVDSYIHKAHCTV